MRAIIITEFIAVDLLDQSDLIFHDEKLGQKWEFVTSSTRPRRSFQVETRDEESVYFSNSSLLIL